MPNPEPEQSPDQSSPPDIASAELDAEFVRLFSQNQQRIYLYLMSLVSDANIADDVFQETMLVLWREFRNYQPGTNFMAWACTVAFNQVRAWRKRQQRDRLQFSDKFLAAVAEELDAQADVLDQRHTLLSDCLAQLPQHHRQLVAYRYTAGHAIDHIAQQTQRSIDAVYRLLSRIRKTLHECVSRKLAAEDAQ